MKKILISVIVLVICLSLSVPPTLAGSKQRHRWEGVAIGVGAAILGHALANRHQNRYDRAEVGERRGYHYDPPAPRRRSAYFPPRPSRRGHWKVEKVWIAPTYKKVWNPAHYNRKDKWVPGKWIKITDQPGYWTERQVWGRR